MSVGLYVVDAAAKICLHELDSVAIGLREVEESVHVTNKQVKPCQMPEATDSMSEMTVLTSPSMSVRAPWGFVNTSSMTETTSSPSERMSSRISGAIVGSASMKEVTSLKPAWISSQTSVARSFARFSKAPGTLPWRTSQTNWPACCSLVSSSWSKSRGRLSTSLETLGFPESKRLLSISLECAYEYQTFNELDL